MPCARVAVTPRARGAPDSPVGDASGSPPAPVDKASFGSNLVDNWRVNVTVLQCGWGVDGVPVVGRLY
jgi:hypothetical protein